VGCVGGQVQPGPAGVMGDAAGDGEQSQAESFRFPHPGVFAGECEHLHPRGQFGGQHDDRDPDLILREVMQGKVSQTGVLHVPNPVLTPCSPAVPQFQVRELPAGGVRDERGEPVPLEVGEPELRTGVRPFGPDDDPHPVWPTGQVQQSGQFGDPRAVPWPAVGVIGRGPCRLRDQFQLPTAVSVRLNPTEYCSRCPVSQVTKSWVPPAPRSNQHCPTWPPTRGSGRKLGQRGFGHLDVIDRGVRAGVTLAQDHRDGFTGATITVIHPGADRVMTKTAFESWRSGS